MHISIITEPAFENSSWCKTILNGLFKALSRKKLSYTVVTKIPDKHKDIKNHFLILIASDEKWLTTAISCYRDRKIHPIVLSCQLRHPMSGVYSSVTSDIRQSIYYLITHLAKRGKTRPALYGINPASLPNLARKDSFLEFAPDGINETDIYYNNGSLRDCFENFIKHYEKYDCVICANDYAAISLLQNLDICNIPSDKLLPVSYGGTLLAGRYSNRLLTISMCYEEYGKAAVSICETLHKNPALLYLNIAVKCKIGTSDQFAATERPPDDMVSMDNTSQIPSDELFYSDKEMCDMILTENVLSACDKTDLTILSMILDGHSYDNTAEICFMSPNTVKYRLKKLMEICGKSTKKEFIDFLKMYYK